MVTLITCGRYRLYDIVYIRLSDVVSDFWKSGPWIFRQKGAIGHQDPVNILGECRRLNSLVTRDVADGMGRFTIRTGVGNLDMVTKLVRLTPQD